MNKISLLKEIGKFMVKVRHDYNYNIISKDKYELMHIKLNHLINEIDNTDLLISIAKFNVIKTTYTIMKYK